MSLIKVNSSMQLSFDLLIRKLKLGNPENVVVSPMSLDATVAMLGAGCSPSSAAELLRFAECETLDELKSKFAKSLDVTTSSSGKDCPRITYPQIPVYSPVSPRDEDRSPVFSPGGDCPKITDSPVYSPVGKIVLGENCPIYSPGYYPGEDCPKITDYEQYSPDYYPGEDFPMITDYEQNSPVYYPDYYPGEDFPKITDYEQDFPVYSPGKDFPKITDYEQDSPVYAPVHPYCEDRPKNMDYQQYSPVHPYCEDSPEISDHEQNSPVYPYCIDSPIISPIYPYRLPDRTDKDPKISFVNAAWVDMRTPFQPEYEECLKHVFKIEATTTCDFVNQVDEAVKQINSWGSSQTNGLIKNLVTPAGVESMEVILTNALYFKGFWPDKTFDPKFTKERDFFLGNGEKVPKVPFMTSSHSHRFASFDDFKVLEIPYRSTRHEFKVTKQFCMQIILPHEQDRLQTLLEKLEHKGLLDFKLEDTLFEDLWIPRFKFSSTLGNEDLRFPFLEGGKELELTKMVQKGEGVYFCPTICQKAFIEVEEEGTEAAAVTAFCYNPMSPVYEPRPGKFVADHPFLFIIKEKISGLVLFVGTLLNPLES